MRPIPTIVSMTVRAHDVATVVIDDGEGMVWGHYFLHDEQGWYLDGSWWENRNEGLEPMDSPEDIQALALAVLLQENATPEMEP